MRTEPQPRGCVARSTPAAADGPSQQFLLVAQLAVVFVATLAVLGDGAALGLAALVGSPALRRRLGGYPWGRRGGVGAKAFLFAADVGAAAVGVMLATLILGYGARLTVALQQPWSLAGGLGLVAVAVALAVGMAPVTRVRALVTSRAVRRAGLALVVALAVAAVGAALGDLAPLPPHVAGLAVVIGVVVAPSMRRGVVWCLRASGAWSYPAVVVGAGHVARLTTSMLRRDRRYGVFPVAHFSDDPDDDVRVGPVDDAWAFLHRANVRHVVVCPDAGVDMDTVLRHAPTHVSAIDVVYTARAHALVDDHELRFERFRNYLASGTRRVAKRGFDVAASLVLVTLLAPLLLMVAAMVRLDSRGPAIYPSPRIGRRGVAFPCLKFRTMHVDAEERLQDVLASDPAMAAEYAQYHKLTDDPRVTRIGRFLRSSSLDELPQLFNVLVGHMSLVGPRPYLVRERADMGLAHNVITLVRPGITGSWQVSGRNGISFDERVELESAYVRQWSLAWDAWLLLRTPLAVLERKTG